LRHCVPTQQIYINIFSKFVWFSQKIALPLHRYPENNLFTLKRLIPIEDIERLPGKVIALFFAPTQNVKLS
jgi:hypothetical protein